MWVFSCLFFSFYLITRTVPFLHSLFFSYLLNNRREKERERERGVREKFYVWARYINKRSFCVCASSFDAKTSPFVVILLIRCTF